jgi:hypothetical protein
VPWAAFWQLDRNGSNSTPSHADPSLLAAIPTIWMLELDGQAPARRAPERHLASHVALSLQPPILFRNHQYCVTFRENDRRALSPDAQRVLVLIDFGPSPSSIWTSARMLGCPTSVASRLWSDGADADSKKPILRGDQEFA